MGQIHNLNLKAGIKFNGVDILDIHPDKVKEVIASLPKDQQKIIKAIIKSKQMPDFPLPNNYAEHAGRPSLKKLPYMRSENDGMPYLTGHSPSCDGKIAYPQRKGGRATLCFCKWVRRHV
jgi:hypothetical protein